MVPGCIGVVPGNLGLITGYQVGGPEYLARVPGYLSLSLVTYVDVVPGYLEMDWSLVIQVWSLVA